MFRGLVLFSLITLFSIPSAAQFGAEERRASALANANQHFPASIGSRSMTGSEARISAVGLREPHKLKELTRR